MAGIEKTGHFSYKINELPKGCRHCVRGEKLVLFITGKCSTNCCYCPISDNRKNKDDVWANEWKVKGRDDVLEEARLCSAKGAGITGGDPLLRLDRTIKYILLLKSAFGKDFHIHLYTPLTLVTKLKLQKLYDAGLDEIRFHPRLDRPDEWRRILMAEKFGWDIGIEIPAFPDKGREMARLVEFAKPHVKFININELEMSDSNACQLSNLGFAVKNRLSYGVRGSEKLALALLDGLVSSQLNVHYCPARLKDAVQMRNRIARRASNIARKFDSITPDGTLLRGAIYLKSLMPGFDYKLRLQTAKKGFFLKRLYKIKKDIKADNRLAFDSIEVDRNKLRIISAVNTVKRLASYLKARNLVPAIVEEYPTYDALEVDVRFI
jgi:pyruvate formate-lyase activating enzyme-like uncharacterized protein